MAAFPQDNSAQKQGRSCAARQIVHGRLVWTVVVYPGGAQPMSFPVFFNRTSPVARTNHSAQRNFWGVLVHPNKHRE